MAHIKPLVSRLLKGEKKFYYLMLLLPLIYLLIFRYMPMAGASLAFRRYSVTQGYFGGDWVGLRYFKLLFSSDEFFRAFSNNLILGGMLLVFAFPVPIIFAILLNEMKNGKFKSFTQTVSYLPHFISVIVVAGMLKELLSPNSGAVNMLIEALGGEKIFFLGRAEWFRSIYLISDIWQQTGWQAVIFFAALSTVEPQLYEAAELDGANRFQKMTKITLPSIMPVIIYMFTIRIGQVLRIGFEKVLLLYSPTTYSTADILSTYAYRMGIERGMYSYATAIELFNAVVGFSLVLLFNRFAKKTAGISLW